VILKDSQVVHDFSKHQLKGKVVPLYSSHLQMSICWNVADQYSQGVKLDLKLAHEAAVGIAYDFQRETEWKQPHCT
jgi:hypothetical protein